MLRYRLRDAQRNWFPRPDDMNPTLHALLIQRGVSSAEEAARFLHPSADHLRDPFLLNDMDRAVERIRAAMDAGGHICVYGDYDVDGVSASSLLSDYLRRQGADVEAYLPSRHNEGYGLNEAAVRAIAGRSQLMVTVDCGVTSVELVALAKSLGLDVVVTDHHRPAEALPDCPVVNPLLNGYPFPSLCGAGVAFKLVHALGGLDAAMEYVDIAALATVADVVPLLDENRVIVRLGLDRINRNPRPGLRALIDAAGLSGRPINAGSIAFQLAPRLNAGGRIGSAMRSYALLLSPTEADARPISEELEGENRSRKEIEQRILAEAEAQLEGFDFPAHRALVLAGRDWNPGVIGLAASRLVEKYRYPVILLSDSDGTLTGSCRSIPGVDIHGALTAVQKHLIRFGGHRQAAGLTMDAVHLDAFRQDLDDWIFQNVPPACFVPSEEYDMEVHFEQLTEPFVAGLEALQPTGFGNPAPVLRAKDVYVMNAQAVGAEGAHLRMKLSEQSVHRNGIFFRGGHLAERLPETVDVLFSPKLNTFMGRTDVQLELKSVNPADAMSVISAKIPDEDELQHEFLTEVFYNKIIDIFDRPAKKLTEQELKKLLAENPQGTLILTADFAEAARLCATPSDCAPDIFIRELPEDPRAFNALCVYAPTALPEGYRRIVLAGAPPVYRLPEGAEVFAVEARAEWLRALPDVDALREVYKAVRNALGRSIRFDSFAMLAHVVASTANQRYITTAAALLALCDMGLIDIRLDAAPVDVRMRPMKKTDPESSAVWRALQAWRTEALSQP